jgi:hypothetical protein
MPKKIHAELEKAILELPSKEKNKLLLRLVAKSELLIDQLQYRLLESSQVDLDFRVEQLRDEFGICLSIFGYNNGRQCLQLFKNLSAKINYHKKVTADKLSELRVMVEMLEFILSKCSGTLGGDGSILAEKFRVLYVKKLAAAIKLLSSVHEDYHIEFSPKIEAILDFCHQQTYLKWLTASQGLPKTLD